MTRVLAALAVILLGGLPACGDNISTTITLDVTSPARGALLETGSVTVSGTATSDVGRVRRVEVNGQTTRVADDGSFRISVVLEPGTNTISTTAFAGGNQTTDVRAVSSGPLVATPVPFGLIMRMGNSGMASQAAAIRQTIDMPTIYAGAMATPVKDAGTGCTRDIVSASAIDMPVQILFMYGLLDGLGGEVLFAPVDMSYSADYMDSGCAAQTGTFDFDTVELHWSYSLDVSLGATTPGVFEATISNTVLLYDHPLEYVNGTIEAAVFDRVALDTHDFLATRMIEQSTPEVERRTTEFLNGLGSTGTVVVGGDSLAYAIEPAELLTSSADGFIMRFASLLGDGSTGTYVPTPADPIRPRGGDAMLAIADDALDQALGAAWRAGAFNITVPSGAVLELLVPPVARARPDGRVAVVVADWVATASGAEVSLSAEMELAPEASTEVLRLIPLDAAIAVSPIRGELGEDSAALLVAEAAASVQAEVAAAIASLGVPVADHAANDLAATANAGYVEIGFDFDQ